jgi:hypothetical protein
MSNVVQDVRGVIKLVNRLVNDIALVYYLHRGDVGWELMAKNKPIKMNDQSTKSMGSVDVFY